MSHSDVFALVKLADGALMPEYKTAGSSGLDLAAHLGDCDYLRLAPGEAARVHTGVFLSLPAGAEGQIRPRSGVSARGLLVMFGTIDADYRGELQIVVWNISGEDQVIAHGERIAQLVVAPVLRCHLRLVAELDETERGDGGFGSTGT